MPELPEVEFCRRALERWGRDRRIVDVEVLDARVVSLAPADGAGAIAGARRGRSPRESHREATQALRQTLLAAAPEPPVRHGKRLCWPFGPRALLVHLGMTGKWTRVEGPHDKVRLRLDDGSRLCFVDPRILGVLAPMDRSIAETSLHQGLGPDALGAELPVLVGRRPVKVALLDQSILAGIGNVQAMEALWRAGIHPATTCDGLRPDQRERLSHALQETLRHTLDMLGEGDQITYVEESLAANPFDVYRRANQPCVRCKTKIERLEQAGRSTYWCPRCQAALPNAPPA
jgi:formamidopyrimidine-DNA glycosylase